MTSKSGADALARDLRFHRSRPAVPDDGIAIGNGGDRFRFELDFDSPQAWPDLPYDAASCASHYDADTQLKVSAILRQASRTMVKRAPVAFAFVNTQMQRALLRKSESIDGASSASNRTSVGQCVLTNLHLQADAVQIAIEGLVHESIHQYLYRTELADGHFCDLAETPTFRSPWSGSRLPLHSLVHACFVWFGLLSLWSELALAPESEAEASRSRERISHCLFGFTFLDDVLVSPSFPRASVDPHVFDCLRDLAVAARRAAHPAAPGTLREFVSMRSEPAWPAALASSLSQVSA